MISKSFSKISTLAAGFFILGIVVALPVFTFAQPDASPPGGTVNAEFDTVTVGPGLFDFVVQPGGGSNTEFSTSGNMIFDLNGGIGTLFFQNNVGSTTLAMNAFGIWNTQSNLLLADSVDVQNSLNVDSGTLFVDHANNEVGIGTTNPSSDFHVAGDARISGQGNNVGLAVNVGNYNGTGIAAIFDNGGGTAVELSDPTYSIEANGDIRTYGSITANYKLGCFYNKAGSYYTVNSGGNAYAYVSCDNTGQQAVGCGYYGSYDLDIFGVEFTDDYTCRVRARNTTGVSKSIRANVRCFDPGLTTC